MIEVKRKYFISSRERLLERAFYIKLFSVVINLPEATVPVEVNVKDTFILDYSPDYFKDYDENYTFTKYDLIRVTISKTIYYAYVNTITQEDSKVTLELVVLQEFNDKPLFTFTESIEIQAGDIENYSETSKLLTSCGRFVLNYGLLVFPFGDKISYLNKIFKPKAIDSLVAKKLVDGVVTIEQLKKYQDAIFMYGHMPEMCVSTVTTKSLATSEEIIKEKERLIQQNINNLHDPLVAKAINDRLVGMEKERLKGDPAERFYDSRGSSAWNIHRAKMHLNVGGIPDFSDDVGKMTYIPRSLMEGWDVNTMDSVINETFKGFYTRGVQTQLGGAQTKIILRMFQGSKIIAEDCGSKQGIAFNITEKNVASFDGMYEAVSMKNINEKTYKDFIGKKVIIRSPLTCKIKHSGYCYKCWGDLYKKRGAESVELDGIYISSKFMLLMMKNMHGTEIQTTNLDLENYLISNF